MSCGETNRNKWRLNRLPQTLDIKNDSLSRRVSDASPVSLSSTNLNTSRSSMLVRTLEDSLNGIMLVELRRKGRSSKLSLSNENISIVRSSNSSSSKRDSNSSSSERGIFVQFSRVVIREYPVIPGDNPAVPDGPPLTLDWTPTNSFSVTINRFEKFREGNRRDRCQMKMSMQMRMAFLLEQEYDAKRIMIATRKAAAVRHQRLQTIKSLTLSDTERRIESIQRKIMNAFRRKENREDKEMQRCTKILRCI